MAANRVLRFQAPVAVCTLTSEDLTAAVVRKAGPEIAIAGALHTENLGIERLIQNVLANPHTRFVLLCGADSQQAVGHYPGQSLAALGQHGLDERRRIIGAQGRRPILKNLSPEAVAYFREVVEVIDLIGETDPNKVLLMAQRCAARNPGPAKPFAVSQIVTPVPGYLPARMVSPYNNYQIGGLPPGPVGAPSRASLEAVLAPPDMPYLYFVGAGDGRHVFSQTYGEHLRAIARVRQ